MDIADLVPDFQYSDIFILLELLMKCYNDQGWKNWETMRINLENQYDMV